MTLRLELPDDEVIATLSPDEARLDLICSLYARGKVGKVRGSELAGVDFFAFQRALGERGIGTYTVEEIETDVRTLRELHGT